jgi:predicted RNA binding protein YcfA (HicA-like mRNA interferase family)
VKLPRDISGEHLIRMLEKLGYRKAHQTGSHVRLVHEGPSRHMVTVPMHSFIKVGTLEVIFKDVGKYLGITIEEIEEEE